MAGQTGTTTQKPWAKYVPQVAERLGLKETAPRGDGIAPGSELPEGQPLNPLSRGIYEPYEDFKGAVSESLRLGIEPPKSAKSEDMWDWTRSARTQQFKTLFGTGPPLRRPLENI